MAHRRVNRGREPGASGRARSACRPLIGVGLLLASAAALALALRAGLPGLAGLAATVAPPALAQSVPPPSAPSKEYVYGGGRLIATEEPGVPLAASFVSQSVPSAMTAGQSYAVSVTMRNTGTSTWTSAANFRLGSQNPQDNATWVTGRVGLPYTVAPGGDVTFAFTVTAPPTPGAYNFQWRMVQDGVAWFGDPTANVAITVSAPTGGSISALFAAQTAPVNLTAEGTQDWAHWGSGYAPGLDRKAGVAPQISDYVVLGTGGVGQFGDLAFTHAWSDGAPTGAASTSTGVYVSGDAGNGFRVTAPADTSVRTLKLYVGAWSAQGRLQAQLSDGSAAPYTDASVAADAGTSNYVYTISYKAASAGQTLTVSYTLLTNYNSPYGNVTLQAAALTLGTPPPPPPNDAAFVSQSVPTSMVAGQTYAVSVTMRNTGANTWAAAGGYNLGSQNPQDNTAWGMARVAPPSPAMAGAQATFAFTVTAPTVPGTYNFQWRMVQDGVEWFGAYTTNVAVTVTSPASAGSLAGGSSLTQAGTSVSLTAEGTQDWAHWGLTTPSSFDRKAGAAQQISNFAVLGAGGVGQFGDLAFTHAWSDGAPTGAASTSTGVYVSGDAGNGFRVTAPADTAARTLKLYVGAWCAEGTLTAQLSDGSAAGYSATSADGVCSTVNRVYTLTYKAASAGQWITVEYRLQSNHNYPYGNVTLQAATLSGGGPAPTNLVATATAFNPPSATVTVSWGAPASGAVTSYVVERAGLVGQFQPVGQPVAAPATSFADTTAAEGAAYLYRVKAVFAGGGSSDYSNTDLATAVAFTDDPLVGANDPQQRPPTAVKAAHLIELRRAVSAVHALAGLGAVTTWTYPDPVSSPPQQRRAIYLEDVTDLRARLAEALPVLGLAPPQYVDPTMTRHVTAVRKEHFQQLRDAVK